MTSPNPSDLPKYLCYNEEWGYFLDWRVKAGAGERRRTKRLGFIPKAQALRIHAGFYEEMLNKRLGLEEKRQYTFRQAVDSFLVYSRGNKRSWRDDEKRAGSLAAFFGDMPLGSLSLDLVEQYKQKRKAVFRERRLKEIKPATLNRDLACLKTIVNRAMNNGQLQINPVRGLKLQKEGNERDRTLSREEYEKLLSNCSGHLKPIVQLAYLTGMRRGEILGLKWGQVDLKKGLIVLGAGETKNGEERAIPLNAGLVALFEGLPRILNCPCVFTFRKKGISKVVTAFQSACVMAGIRDFHFHDLRHCAVTNLRKAGVNDKVIMSISGHKTASVFRRYNRVDMADKQEALDRLGEFLESRGVPKESTA